MSVAERGCQRVIFCPFLAFLGARSHFQGSVCLSAVYVTGQIANVPLKYAINVMIAFLAKPKI